MKDDRNAHIINHNSSSVLKNTDSFETSFIAAVLPMNMHEKLMHPLFFCLKKMLLWKFLDFSNYPEKKKNQFDVHDRGSGVKVCTINLMCYSWDWENACIFAFLTASCPSSHFSISDAESLSSEHPQKKKTSRTTTIKHLAVDWPIFVFTNVTNPMEPLFPGNKSNQCFGLLRSGVALLMVTSSHAAVTHCPWTGT